MKQKWKLLLTLFLITWVTFSSVLFIFYAHNYLGKSYFHSNYFQSEKENFIEQLGRYVLEPFDAKEAKENLTVTQEEIEYHRNYYGTLTEQVENIRTQYSDRIFQAEETNDDELKKLLIEERDTKIADIKENFKNDEHVEEKIRKAKEEMIEQYAKQEEFARKEFLNTYSYFAYNVTNIATGETFKAGDMNSNDIFKVTFGNQNPYLNVNNNFYLDSSYDYAQPGIADEINPFTIESDISQFEGTISIPKSMFSASNFSSDYRIFTIAKIIFYIFWATGILAIIGLLTVAKPSFAQFTMTKKYKDLSLKLPADVRLVLIFILATTALAIIEGIGSNIQNNIYYYNENNIVPYILEEIVKFIIVFVSISIVIFGSILTWESINNEENLKQQLKGSFVYRLADGIQDLFLNRSIGIQSVVILIITFLAGVGIVGAAIDGNELVVVYLVLFFFIALPSFIIFLRRMSYLNRIMKQTKEMAEGRLTTPIKVKGKSPFARHAAHLNELREGVKKSLSEQAKSERLKTELITNVSHDLRTPLTSIITYTDLLKNPNITEEERKKYIDVLDKKSARLKTLIEDLFEVSKMASGNIEMNKQRIDLTQLMQQAVGEHKEEFANLNLDLRVTMPDEPLFAYVDGQKWWRVIDNLVVNALKYSLEGTRVYVTLKKNGIDAEFTVKNITKYELNENVEELTERFKRADASRHTDGSGLGLAIAQSIVDLHNGWLNVEVDGDLFKVTVIVPTEY